MTPGTPEAKMKIQVSSSVETDTLVESDGSRSANRSPNKGPIRTEEAHHQSIRTASEESGWSKAVAKGRESTQNEITISF